MIRSSVFYINIFKIDKKKYTRVTVENMIPGTGQKINNKRIKLLKAANF